MPRPVSFKIDTGKKFVRLPHAPIVEAVVQWRATPSGTGDQSNRIEALKSRFSDFDVQQRQHGIEAGSDGLSKEMEQRPGTNPDGYQLVSHDQKHICQFRPTTVIFSRLAPYEGWEKFIDAALPFWKAFVEWESPSSIDRIGVRFISQINLKGNEDLADYVDQPRSPLENIGLSPDAFFQQDNFAIPGYPYRLDLIRTIQLQQMPLIQKSLIVDIDVATKEATPLELAEGRLQEMRFIKNEVFFALMKDAEAKFS